MAFQIVDDILDLREGSQQLGKPAGHDLTQGTVTLPTIIYASGLTDSSEAMSRLRDVVSGELDKPEDVNRVIQDIRSSGALEASMLEAERFATRAKSHAAVTPDSDTREMLAEIADIVIERSA
jgi:heptaprenyl diphosphate synthase/octaprenyl-diphosphate synthase